LTESSLVEEVFDVLKRAGYQADLILYPREERSVDIVASSGGKPLFLKIVQDAKEISKHEISDLKKIRAAYDTSTVIVATRHYNKELEDDVVYVKYGSNVITLKTLENYLIKREKPLVACVRGNYILKINPQKFRQRREELQCSRGMLADILGTSRKTIYMYERGEMYISVDKALRLASMMGEDIFEEFDPVQGILEYTKEENSTPRDSVEELIFQLAKRMGHMFLNFTGLPVDIALKGEIKVSVVKDDPNYLDEKVKYAEKIATATKAAVFLVRSKHDINGLAKLLSKRESTENTN